MVNSMTSTIVVSKESKKLLQNFFPLELENWPSASTVQSCRVIDWLERPISDPKKTISIEELRASLLEDLVKSWQIKDYEAPEKVAPECSQFLFGYLLCAGMILAICEGFDGIVSILNTIALLPASWVFFVGLCFSSLAIIVFLGFDFEKISEKLKIHFSSSSEPIDILLKQVEEINELYQIILKKLVSNDREELKLLLKAAKMLEKRFAAFDDNRAAYLKILETYPLLIVQKFGALLCGILYFSSGFFSGQSLAIAIVGMVWGTTATLMWWPILATAIAVGLAAFSIYWNLQRPDIEEFLGKWVGVNAEKIKSFAEPNKVRKEREALTVLTKLIEAKLEPSKIKPNERNIDVSSTFHNSMFRARQLPRSQSTGNISRNDPPEDRPNRDLRSAWRKV
jgi:hypothetical protein